MKITSILLIAALFCAVACHKTDTAALAPTLSIAAPLGDDQFTSGQSIAIKGETGDADGLHTLTIKITDDKTKVVLFTQSPAVLDKKTYTYNVAWTAKVTDWTDATVTVTAANHGGKETIKTAKIKIWL
jgi:hypothetical protein